MFDGLSFNPILISIGGSGLASLSLVLRGIASLWLLDRLRSWGVLCTFDINYYSCSLFFLLRFHSSRSNLYVLRIAL